MNARHLFALLLALGVAVPATAARPNDDDAVRSGFLISRRDAARKTRVRAKRPAKPLGLGYSVFRATANGGAVRVDPSRGLRDGDMIRVVVEANTDGYLYVFNTDDRGSPAAMIYPDPRLGGGDNRIRAHVPTEIPSSREKDPTLRWLHLEGGPVVDQLHVVVSREPLDGVPVGRELTSYCASRGAECLWAPDERSWAGLASKTDAAQQVSLVAASGEPLTEAERSAVERKVRLRPSAPAPAVVRMNASDGAPLLVTRVALPH